MDRHMKMWRFFNFDLKTLESLEIESLPVTMKHGNHWDHWEEKLKNTRGNRESLQFQSLSENP